MYVLKRDGPSFDHRARSLHTKPYPLLKPNQNKKQARRHPKPVFQILFIQPVMLFIHIRFRIVNLLLNLRWHFKRTNLSRISPRIIEEAKMP